MVCSVSNTYRLVSILGTEKEKKGLQMDGFVLLIPPWAAGMVVCGGGHSLQLCTGPAAAPGLLQGSWQGWQALPMGSLHVPLPAALPIKGNLQEIPGARGGKQMARASCVIFSSICLAPEYPLVPWELQFGADTRICKRWLMKMRFQGRSLSVT